MALKKEDLRESIFDFTVGVVGLQEFCEIGKLSTDLRAKNRKIVNQIFFDFLDDSHTGKLSKIVHSHTRKLSN